MASQGAADNNVCQSTETEVVDQKEEETVVLTLRKPKSSKKVVWTEETIDNEHLARKKSKCCCVYRKPHQFGESSSESEDECDNCHGHVEMKNKKEST